MFDFKFTIYNLFQNRVLSPPLHAGDALTLWSLFSHWDGVLATMERACMPFSNSTSSALFTSRCLWIRLIASNSFDTTTTLKCVSLFLGTLCIWLSLRTWRCVGFTKSVSCLREDARFRFRRRSIFGRKLWTYLFLNGHLQRSSWWRWYHSKTL